MNQQYQPRPINNNDLRPDLRQKRRLEVNHAVLIIGAFVLGFFLATAWMQWAIVNLPHLHN